jgi:hypothetical protein
MNKPAQEPRHDRNDAAEQEPAEALLDLIEVPVPAAAVMLTSGRRYDLEAGADADHLVIRSRGGDVVLRVEVTDAGPVLSFSGATIDLEATRRLRMAAGEILIEASGDVALSTKGSLREHVEGDHHIRVAGDERVEAASVQIQANTGAVGVRAMECIALDGEHIGLNDAPVPQPFPWSEAAERED